MAAPGSAVRRSGRSTAGLPPARFNSADPMGNQASNAIAAETKLPAKSNRGPGAIMSLFFLTSGIYLGGMMRCSLLGQPALLPDYVWIPLKASPALLLLASVICRTADPLPGNGARGRKPGVEATAVCLALVFSAFGDVLLELEAYTELAFLFGLSSFAVAHMFFIMAFARKAASPSFGQVMLIAFEILAVGGNLAPMFVKGAPEELKVPVGVYITIIVVMVISATLAEVPTGVGPSALAGAIAFATSDAVIGIDRFVGHKAVFEPIITTTYFLAQYMLTRGLVHEVAGSDETADRKDE